MSHKAVKQVSDFIVANNRSPVVGRSTVWAGKSDHSARAVGIDYILEDQTRHRLSAEAHLLLPDGYPKYPCDGLPAYEPEVCGTHHLIAERALRIVESPLIEQVDQPTITALRDLCSEAGVAFARLSLKQRLPEADLPF